MKKRLLERAKRQRSNNHLFKPSHYEQHNLETTLSHHVGHGMEGRLIPNVNDVMSGRGKFASSWTGNIYYRQLIQRYKLEYIIAEDVRKKQEIAEIVISNIRRLDPPGRFIVLDSETNTWHDMGDESAARKTKQALREDAPKILDEIVPEVESSISNAINNDECDKLLKILSL